jgi:hypothetical protein
LLVPRLIILIYVKKPLYPFFESLSKIHVVLNIDVLFLRMPDVALCRRYELTKSRIVYAFPRRIRVKILFLHEYFVEVTYVLRLIGFVSGRSLLGIFLIATAQYSVAGGMLALAALSLAVLVLVVLVLVVLSLAVLSLAVLALAVLALAVLALAVLTLAVLTLAVLTLAVLALALAGLALIILSLVDMLFFRIWCF